MIAPVLSLAQLQSKAKADPKYKALAILTAEDYVLDPQNSFKEAMRLLRIEAKETSEDEVIEQMNFLRAELGEMGEGYPPPGD